jgi:hypothetical protein
MTVIRAIARPAQFTADELGDEFLEELGQVEPKGEGFGAAGTGTGKVRRMNSVRSVLGRSRGFLGVNF